VRSIVLHALVECYYSLRLYSCYFLCFFFSSRRRHTRFSRDWSSDVCSSDLVGFLFAPNHHQAMKYAIGPRKELGIRSIFNLLGPLTNPAGVNRLVIGVFSNELCRPIAEVMKQLGAEHVMVVHSRDGLDEISIASSTHVAELKNGEVTEWEIIPESVDIESQTLTGLIV